MRRMFTVAERAKIQEALLHKASEDTEVVAAALVGSGATGRQDEWSDIDLMLRLAEEATIADVATNWTKWLYETANVTHHLDIQAQGALYRVFLLPSSLQIDISFWPNKEFRATQPGFKLVFGTTNPPTKLPEVDPNQVAGMGWLYALHARSAIARGRRWQAVMMLDGIRDQIITLACLRHDKNPHQGRGADQLPPEVLTQLAKTRAANVEAEELRRANKESITMLLAEIAHHNPTLAHRLTEPAKSLASP